MTQKILILNFGSQFSPLVARRVREANVYCEIFPYSVSRSIIKDFNPNGIILSGSSASALSLGSPSLSKEVFDLGKPVLGICYGMQVMAIQLGGKVKHGRSREFGPAKLKINCKNRLLNEEMLEASGETVWTSHSDEVVELPPNFLNIASTENNLIAAMADEEKNFFGLQFHPEVTHTVSGNLIFKKFLYKICSCNPNWTTSNYQSSIVKNIKEQVGDKNVILGLSGGIDSLVSAKLIDQAIGKQLNCLFIDHGLNVEEDNSFLSDFGHELQGSYSCVNAREKFFSRLSGVTDPEEKREVIGKTFLQIFQKEANKIPNVKWLAQGTIYPDRIESGLYNFQQINAKIKSHHNLCIPPGSISLKLLEPLKDLFKDEVRKLAVSLGLHPALVLRHPFPGPGLAIRVLGEVKREWVDILRRADKIFLEELRSSGWYERLSQAFAVFLPIRSVGVMGDARTYDYVIALRAIQTVDFMTASPAPLPAELLAKISANIINRVHGINRVVYDISSKPPATIEWE